MRFDVRAFRGHSKRGEERSELGDFALSEGNLVQDKDGHFFRLGTSSVSYMLEQRVGEELPTLMVYDLLDMRSLAELGCPGRCGDSGTSSPEIKEFVPRDCEVIEAGGLGSWVPGRCGDLIRRTRYLPPQEPHHDAVSVGKSPAFGGAGAATTPPYGWSIFWATTSSHKFMRHLTPTDKSHLRRVS